MNDYINYGIDLINRCISISGELTKDSCARYIRGLQLMSLDHKDITIYINSEGGSVYDGLALIDMIEHYKKQGIKIITVAQGEVMSMGAVLFVCGSYRYITKNTTVMFHACSAGNYGNVNDLEVSVKETRRLNDILEKIIRKNTSYKEKLDKDVFLDSKAAIKYKVADSIL